MTWCLASFDAKWNALENYPGLCTVAFDKKRAEELLIAKRAEDSIIYHQMIYDIILNFGLTELTAQVCWKKMEAGTCVQGFSLTTDDVLVLEGPRIPVR